MEVTAKQTAEALFKKMDDEVKKGGYDGWHDTRISKDCALVAVDEMISIFSSVFMTEGSLMFNWLNDVKKELEAMK